MRRDALALAHAASRPGTRLGGAARAIDPGACRRSVRGKQRASDGACRARSRQDAAQCAGRSARGGRFPALLRRAPARDFDAPDSLPGPTGEDNDLSLHGRGVFACIAPWNFPLAIFTGQVAAALAAGNTVLAKPAEQTPLIAAAAVRLLHEAGVPTDALHLLPGDGPRIGAALFGDPRLAGVAFTGSTEAAQAINRALAARDRSASLR